MSSETFGDLCGKAVLVTGAAGCIGAWVVKLLLEAGAKPIVFDLTNDRARLNLIAPNATETIWCVGDITDYDSLCAVMDKHLPVAIIHLAALQVPYCKSDPLTGARVNVMGTANVLEASRQFGLRRLAFASSIAAPAMASDNAHLATLYGAHKVCGEQMASVYWQDWQVPSVCIRPGVIYGPARDRGMSAAPTLAMLAAFFGLPYTIPFSGPVAFVHVADAAYRFIASVSRDMEGAYVFDMQGTEADVVDVARGIESRLQGADITVSGDPLPFPHAPDDGRLDAHIDAPPYRSMADGIAHTLDIFAKAREHGVLTPAIARKLIGTEA